MMSRRRVGPRPMLCHRAAGLGGGRARDRYPGQGRSRRGGSARTPTSAYRSAGPGRRPRPLGAGRCPDGRHGSTPGCPVGYAVRCWRAARRRFVPPCLGPARPSSKRRRLVARGSLSASVLLPVPAGRRCRKGWRFSGIVPRSSCSRSSTLVSSRSSLRALELSPRSRSAVASSDIRPPARSRVREAPRMAASGVRSSWDTAVSTLLFNSSRAASRRVVSSCAIVRSVMSRLRPCQ
jgi:hypothetical protein